MRTSNAPFADLQTGEENSWAALPNARVRLLDAMGRKLAEPVSTNMQGEFEVAFTTSPSLGLGDVELTGWKMVLSAEGHETETIEVGAVKEPKRRDVTVYLVFQAAMRRSPEIGWT